MRLFRIRLRPGRSFFTFTNDGSEPRSAVAGDEVVVTESVAASLVRERAADVIEAVDPESERGTG